MRNGNGLSVLVFDLMTWLMLVFAALLNVGILVEYVTGYRLLP